MPLDRLQDLWLGLRDRLLASSRFRVAAAGFPLTRPVARRRAGALFDLCAGFVYAQILAACVRLRLFEILARGPQGLEPLARQLGLPVAGAERLLKAAVALRLVEARAGGRYGLGALGAALVDNPGLAAMIEHHEMLYRDLADPVALLRGESGATALADFWAYEDGRDSPELTERYTALMSASQPLVAAEVLGAYSFVPHRRLLDVGGGDGCFLEAVAARHPGLAVTLFDLPANAERARRRFAAAGLAGRAETCGGNFHRDRLPAGADAISLVRVLHDHDDEPAMRLLQRVREALPPGGTLVVAEPMAGMDGAERVGDAYFGFYLLAMGQGRPRPAEELSRMLVDAGFRSPRRRATGTPLITQVITAAG